MTEKVKELINTEKTVKLEKSDGTIIEWNFVYEPYGCNPGYWTEQTINGVENKESFLGKDKITATRIWNSLFRHRRDLNED